MLGLQRYEPPVDIGREQAADEAARELSKPMYGRAGDTVFDRLADRLLDWIGDLFGEVANRSPGGGWGLLILLGLLGLVALVVFWRAGVLRTTRAVRAQVFDVEQRRSTREYRTAAEAAVAAGDYVAAIRHRFRACVAELTDRTVLDDRAGRTAYEVVADAAAVVPALGDQLRPAAQVFTEVAYGGRAGTPQRYAVVVAADEAARTVSTRSLVPMPGAAR